MLETFHARFRHFSGADGIWHMALERDLLFFGLVGNGKDSIARDERLQFDEIRTAVLEIGYGAAALVRRGNGGRNRETGLLSIEHVARGVGARADEATGFDLVAPSFDDIEFAAHVPDAGYAVSDKKRQRN